MTGLGYVALGIAVLANFTANIALKRAMQQVGGGSLGDILLGLLGSLAFWTGIAIMIPALYGCLGTLAKL